MFNDASFAVWFGNKGLTEPEYLVGHFATVEAAEAARLEYVKMGASIGKTPHESKSQLLSNLSMFRDYMSQTWIEDLRTDEEKEAQDSTVINVPLVDPTKS